MDAQTCKETGGKWNENYNLCSHEKMKRPKYSSFQWQCNKIVPQMEEEVIPFCVDKSMVVAKGTLNQFINNKKFLREFEKAKTKETITLTIGSGEIRYGDDKPIVVGKGHTYGRRFIYEVAEELLGEKLLLKADNSGHRQIAKNAEGKKITMDVMYDANEDWTPLIIEGNRGQYIVAPVLTGDDW